MTPALEAVIKAYRYTATASREEYSARLMREALVDGGDAEAVLSHFVAQIAVLDPEQLAAVLAHERAHLAGRHHLLLAVTRLLAAIAPFVPLFARGTGEVARLAEMRAGDAAARRVGGQGRRTLLTALLTAGGPAGVTGHGSRGRPTAGPRDWASRSRASGRTPGPSSARSTQP